jgi:hypothetical protein
MKNILISLSFFLFLNSCNNKVTYNVIENKRYTETFEEHFINQFPRKIECINYNIISNTDRAKNDIGLFLYVYGVSQKTFLEERNKARKCAIAKYDLKDKCLLVVNRFETFDTYENRKDVEVTDSTKVNQDCYKNKYPIPNFIDYDNPKKNSDLKLDGNFDIYILDAKAGNYFKEFDLIPNPQMPIHWKNGYSKGIAISESKKIVIYWSVIW